MDTPISLKKKWSWRCSQRWPRRARRGLARWPPGGETLFAPTRRRSRRAPRTLRRHRTCCRLPLPLPPSAASHPARPRPAARCWSASPSCTCGSCSPTRRRLRGGWGVAGVVAWRRGVCSHAPPPPPSSQRITPAAGSPTSQPTSRALRRSPLVARKWPRNQNFVGDAEEVVVTQVRRAAVAVARPRFPSHPTPGSESAVTARGYTRRPCRRPHFTARPPAYTHPRTCRR